MKCIKCSLIDYLLVTQSHLDLISLLIARSCLYGKGFKDKALFMYILDKVWILTYNRELLMYFMITNTLRWLPNYAQVSVKK